MTKIKPTDEHDSLKSIKLSACVEGSKVEITTTVRRIEVATGKVKLSDVVAKLKADAAEYNKSSEIDIDAELRALGVKGV